MTAVEGGIAALRMLSRKALALCVIGASLAVPAGTPAEAFDGPNFRRGLWRFERATEMGKKSAMPGATNVRVEPVVTRCVDPTIAMQENFRPASVGACRSEPPKKIGNRYVFPLRCDFMGPVRTVIEVESEGAYREVHELTVGPPRKDIIFARRIGDCDGYSLASQAPLELVPSIEAGFLFEISARSN